MEQYQDLIDENEDFRKIIVELFLKYANHSKSCEYENVKNCTCGYFDLMERFNNLNVK